MICCVFNPDKYSYFVIRKMMMMISCTNLPVLD